MKIYKLDFSKLSNSSHVQFFTEVEKLLQQSSGRLGVDDLHSRFASLLAQEIKLFKIDKGSEASDAMAEADRKRDELFRGLSLLTEANLDHPDEAKKQAARRIFSVVERFGNPRRLPYNDETALLNSFIREIENKCGDDLVQISGVEWVQELKKANADFEKLSDVRYAELSTRPTDTMREARLRVEPIYKQLCERINALIIIDGDEAYTDFVRNMNLRIEYYKNAMAVQKKEGTPSPIHI